MRFRIKAELRDETELELTQEQYAAIKTAWKTQALEPLEVEKSVRIACSLLAYKWPLSDKSYDLDLVEFTRAGGHARKIMTEMREIDGTQ